MQEDFLHYLWKHKKIEILNLKTVEQEKVELINAGEHNHNGGPDFFNARLKIGGQDWAGNVEIHMKSSDWFVHNHETDNNYDNVILHVVWEHDAEVHRKDNSVIPTLELNEFVNKEALGNYQKLFDKTKKWINCANDFETIGHFTMNNWLDRLYFERLERKSKAINDILKQSKNNWEAVLFKLLAKNFGLKVNGDAFFSIANSFDFSIVRKQQSRLSSLEALFFGQANVLNQDMQEPYYLELQREYEFLRQKFGLTNNGVVPLQFFRLRPVNFPTIRLSQLANLYHLHQNVFSKIIEAKTKEEIYDVFSVGTSEFWENHYTFNKQSKTSKKRMAKTFVDLLIINTIVPLKFSYAKCQGQSAEDDVVGLMQQMTSEKNGIVDAFNVLKPISNTALQSQALIQLKTEYCDKNKCLQCAIGSEILMRRD